MLLRSILLFNYLIFFNVSIYSSSLIIKDAYINPTPNGAKNGVAFMKIFNNSPEDIVITNLKSNISRKTELHTHNMLNGIMRMHKLSRLTIKKKSIVELKSMSYHIMFIGLKKSLKKEDIVKLKLILSSKEEIDIKIPVKSIKHKHKKHNKHISH